MKSPLLSLVKAHRKTSTAVIVIAVYAALGFGLLPWVAQRQVSSLLETRLGLQTRMESVYFNPFSFYLEIEGLELVDPGQGELLTLSHSHLNFQPSRLLLLKLQVAELAVNGITLDVARYSDGSTTASVLAARWQESAEPSTDAEAEAPSDESADLPSAEVRLLTLNDIEIRFSDAVPVTPFSTVFTLNSFQLDDFSTLENTSGTYRLVAEFEDNAPLTIEGEVSMVPLATNGKLSLSQFPLTMLSRYGQDSLPLTLGSGGYNLSLEYQVDLAETEPVISISQLSTSIDTLTAIENGSSAPFLTLTNLGVSGGQINLPQNTASVAELNIDGVNIAALVSESGEVNFVRMLNQVTGSPADQTSPNAVEADPATSENSAPWQIDLTAFTVSDLNLNLEDASLETPFQLATLMNGSIENISNRDGAQFPFDFTLSLGSGGTIATTGQFVALPAVALDSSLIVSQLNLAVIQPYVNEFAAVVLESGNINLETTLTVNTTEPFAARGEFALSSLKVSDTTRNEDLVTLDQLAVDDFALSLGTNAIEVSEVSIDELYARVIINEDASTNISRIIKTSTVDPTEAVSDSGTSGSDTSEPLVMTLGKISINNAAANFTDRDLPIVFNANIRQLNGSGEGFASNTLEAATISLEGQVDEFGLVQITSALNPFNFTQSSEVDVRFTNIDMPAMTAYVIKFAGRVIDEGSIDLGLVYKIQEGQLTANNQMVLTNLKLGERVESPNAMDLPLDLAVALLKDGNGVIDLELPITGDINDPEFDFGPAIRRTLTNVLTNIVAAPFRLLGSLVGGGGDSSLESIRFLPGRSDIAPPEQQILSQLSEALTQRPQLMLEVPPITAPEDTQALKTAKVVQQIEAGLAALPANDSLLTQRRRQVVETLYTATAGAQPLIEIQQLHQQQPAEGAAAAPATPQLDVVAYNADLRQRLIQAESISDQELNALAAARASAVVTFMTESAGIGSGQIRLSDAATSDVDEDGWLIMEFGLGPAN